MKSQVFAASILALTALPVVAEAQESTNVKEIQKQFQEALNLRLDGDLYSAIEALNGILSLQPKLHRARLELALTYYQANEFARVIKLVEETLVDPEVPDDVKENIEVFLSQVKSTRNLEKERRHSFRGSVGVTAGYDDNVSVGPSNDIIELPGGFIVLGGEESDAYTGMTASLSHSYRMPGSMDLGIRPVTAFWQSSASVYRREYQDEHKYTLDVISASTGLALISRQSWRAKVNLQVDFVRLEDDSLVVYTSLNPSWTYNKDNRNEYTLRGQWRYRDYKQDDDADREGSRYEMGFDYGHRFDSNMVFQAGVSLSEQDARERNKESSSYEVYLSLLYPAWPGGNAYARVSYSDTEYEGEAVFFGGTREETDNRYVIGVNHNFADGFTIGARFSYTDNSSNIALYEYDRNEFSLELSKRF